MAGLAGELVRQVAELRGVVDVVVQHVPQHRHGLLVHRAVLGLQGLVAVAVEVVVVMAVGMVMGVIVV